ncbi:MAG TPA: hypothetical protein TECP_00505 [Hyphomicrobiaceae bacterium MAG_BT-2024]
MSATLISRVRAIASNKSNGPSKPATYTIRALFLDASMAFAAATGKLFVREFYSGTA